MKIARLPVCIHFRELGCDLASVLTLLEPVVLILRLAGQSDQTVESLVGKLRVVEELAEMLAEGDSLLERGGGILERLPERIVVVAETVVALDEALCGEEYLAHLDELVLQKLQAFGYSQLVARPLESGRRGSHGGLVRNHRDKTLGRRRERTLDGLDADNRASRGRCRDRCRTLLRTDEPHSLPSDSALANASSSSAAAPSSCGGEGGGASAAIRFLLNFFTVRSSVNILAISST